MKRQDPHDDDLFDGFIVIIMLWALFGLVFPENYMLVSLFLLIPLVYVALCLFRSK